MTEFTTLQIDT